MQHEHKNVRTGSGIAEKALLIGAMGLLAWPAVKGVANRWRVRHPQATREPAIDASLQDTFPASDPPASRFVDIPENHR